MALRVSRRASARACANSPGSPSHHSANDAIASSVRSALPRISSARYSANDATTRARRRASSGCKASAQLKPVGLCVDILAPLLLNPSRVPEVHEEKTAGRRGSVRESEGWRAVQNGKTLRDEACAGLHSVCKASVPTCGNAERYGLRAGTGRVARDKGRAEGQKE